jgi:FkbM family methyltransferase
MSKISFIKLKRMAQVVMAKMPHCYSRIWRNSSLEKRVMLNLVVSGDRVLDIGGNKGHFTLLLSDLVGRTGVVHVFEPVPTTFKSLESRLHREAFYRNIRLHQAAVAAADEHVIIRMPDNDTEQASLAVHNAGSWENAREIQSFQVRSVRLDSLSGVVGGVHFIKCDVEGAELRVIRGGRELLRRCLPILWLEVNVKWTSGFGYHPSELIDELKAIGYDTFLFAGERLAPLAESDYTSGGNVLCACADRHAARLSLLRAI